MLFRICFKNFLESACLVVDQEFVFSLSSSLPLLFLLSFLLLLYLDLFLLRYLLPLPLLEGIAFRLFSLLHFYLFGLCFLLEVCYSLLFFNILLFLLLHFNAFVWSPFSTKFYQLLERLVFLTILCLLLEGVAFLIILFLFEFYYLLYTVLLYILFVIIFLFLLHVVHI